MSILLQLTLGFLLLVCLAQLLGYLLTGKNSLCTEPLQALVYNQVLGMVLLLCVYAAYKTGFRTIMLSALPLIAYLSLYIRKHGNKQVPFQEEILPLLVFSVAAILLAFIMVRGSEFNGLKVPVKDQASYAVIVSGLNQYGVESFTSYLYPIDPSMKASPYHYFELWMAAFVQAFCGYNPVLSLSGVAVAYTFFLLFCVVYPWMRPVQSSIFLRIAGMLFNPAFFGAQRVFTLLLEKCCLLGFHIF